MPVILGLIALSGISFASGFTLGTRTRDLILLTAVAGGGIYLATRGK